MKRVLLILGDLDIALPASTMRRKVEDVRDFLDEEVRRKNIAPKTAQHHWSDIKCMFRETVNSKDRTLQVRRDDPTVGILPPDKGAKRGKWILYPIEVARLLACRDVMFGARVLYAVAIYTGLRAGEVEALEVRDIDLAHGLISVNKAVNRKTGEIDFTKKEETGHVAIEPALRPLLEQLIEGRAADERILWMPVDEDRAESFRRRLAAAGIDREEIFVDDERHKRITFHDLRATHLTWRAVRGDSSTMMMASVLHTSFNSTLEYINRATMLRGIGTPFEPLPDELIFGAEGFRRVFARDDSALVRGRNVRRFVATPMGIEGPLRFAGFDRESSRVVARAA